MKTTTIYVVTVFQKIDNSLDSSLTFGDRRCVGWFESMDEADWAVTNNIADMHNNFYEYAIIERIEPGIFMVDTDRVIYQWNNDKYEKIEIPKELTTVSNFGIG